ncbi:MAG TPA: HEAT repeat domain-containing protein [Acidimicrobiales bacterium]|nr:HEAT repeat domain-containing protein [Acidimicrobiales bacterium]
MVVDHDRTVEHLGVAHRAKDARWSLMLAGIDAVPALKRGLSHPNPRVREACCVVLDHHLEPDCIPDLIANLHHDDAGVRGWALHALACDRCKEGSCRPGESDTVPIAVRMMLEDPDASVRARAIGLVGEAVHRHPAAVDALERALDKEPAAGNRKIIRWWLPGGPRYERTKPKPTRARSELRERRERAGWT